MKIKLVKITSDLFGDWKGTWYKSGEFYFVTEAKAYRFRAVDVSGGIMASDCEVQKGFIAWCKCALKTLLAILGY